MPLSAPTALDANIATGLATVTSVTSNSISPASGDLLVVCTGGAYGADNSISSITTTLSNVGSFTAAASWHGAIGGGFYMGAIYYAYVTGAPGSGTITVNITGGTGYVQQISVLKITGHHATAPAGVNGTNTASAGTTFTVTASGTPAASSTAIGYLIANGTTNTDNNLAPDGAYTELQDQFNWFAAAAIASEWQTQYDAGSADSTCDFTRPATSACVGVVVEIIAAVSELSRRRAVPAAIMRNRRR